MEIQLLRRLKEDIKCQLKWLTQSRLNTIIEIKSPPKYLVACIHALENLFSLSIKYPYFLQKLQEFETLTFHFEFKRERILKSKKYLLEGMLRTFDKFISLVENLVAFAEIHYIAIKEFSKVMHQQLNLNLETQVEVNKINEHLNILNKLQQQNRKMLLKLPLDQMKDSQESDLESMQQQEPANNQFENQIDNDNNCISNQHEQ